MSFCYRCHGLSIWQKEKIVYPYSGGIANQSPRASVALLRLAVQMLMPHVGERGRKIDDDIKNLVSKGLPDQIQKALDSLRVIGNNAVHPGEINIADDYETAASLFDLLNIIIHHFISTQKMIDSIYEKLPESARARIADRDGKPVSQPK
ncbi:DUF4145 domain-containing protein [Brevibacillus fortis]|uniref:DUF4145 domain-containing protein n=1 Tax=Brevibacillus fortis TaxID=2126352 RepID=A0A2P7UVN9_9BACL|nr:hypothetical protein C7R93_20690 [Brevibacillus fortis]